MNLIPLDPPEFDGEEATEVLRVWVDYGPPKSQRFVVLPRLSNDPGAWGILLVDIARQVANAYAVSEPQNDKIYSIILNRIKELFDAEWEHPTE